HQAHPGRARRAAGRPARRGGPDPGRVDHPRLLHRLDRHPAPHGADLRPGGARARLRPGVDGRALLHEHADLVYLAAFRTRRLLPEGRDAGRHHARRHLRLDLALHGPAGHRARAGRRISANCTVAAEHHDEVVDVMRVAVVPVPRHEPVRDVTCEILVAGGGTGGVAAALAAARRGHSVALIEETDWLGGQMTSQGVSALDEHKHIENFGGTRSYYAFRNAIRRHYGRLNPGNCWITRLAFEPRVALSVIEQILPPSDCVYRTMNAERRPQGESHVIAKPEKYEHYRDSQPYSLRIEVHGGEIYGEESGWLEYRLFDQMPGTKGGLWTYRRLVCEPHEITMFNWPGNDYRDRSIIGCTPTEAVGALQDAKRVSLGFLYWLQTEMGAAEIRLRPDVMGSADGLSKHPYIRESRRIQAKKTIVEQEVSAHHQKGPRAAHFADSVGVGWYPIDIHRSGPDDVGASCRTKPFQIPLGALIPVRMENLIAGAKNIGTTHITNGCYRLHPVEWNVGEAVGALPAFALDQHVTPAAVRERLELLERFQARLLGER